MKKYVVATIVGECAVQIGEDVEDFVSLVEAIITDECAYRQVCDNYDARDLQSSINKFGSEKEALIFIEGLSTCSAWDEKFYKMAVRDEDDDADYWDKVYHCWDLSRGDFEEVCNYDLGCMTDAKKLKLFETAQSEIANDEIIGERFWEHVKEVARMFGL